MLKLNNHTWKKYKINFLYKKMTPKLLILHSCKKLQALEKIIFWEKKLSSR